MFSKFKESKIYKYLFILLLFIVSLTSVAFSSWSLGDTKFNSESYKVDDYVCRNDKTGTEYYRIEDALDKASSGQTIVVFSNPYNTTTKTRKEIKITRDCTIKNGVSLILPYEMTKNGNNFTYKYDGRNIGTINKFADNCSADINKYLKCEVSLANNVTLTIDGGNLFIGGCTGTKGAGLSGQTSQEYAQITMGNNSSIIVKENAANSNINCFGYIKEADFNNDSHIIINSGSLTMPFVVYDFRGGTNTVTTYMNGKVSPFNIYDMPNIWSKLSVYSNATVYGYADLYAGDKHNSTNIKIIGQSGSLLNLNSNAYVELKYNHSKLYINESANCKDGNYTTLNFYNGGSLGSLKMTVDTGIPLIGKQSIDTASVLFPYSLKFKINLNSGTYNINNKVKMMPGSNIYLNNDSVLNFNKEFIIYDNFVHDTNNTLPLPYPTSTPAVLTLDGSFTINSDFGGYIKTSSGKNKLSMMNVNTSNLSMTSQEKYALKIFSPLTEYETTQKARSDILNNGIIEKETDIKKTVYVSNTNQDYFNEASNLNKYTINYHLNGGEINGETNETISQEYYFVKGTNVEISSFGIENPTKKYYKFDKWIFQNGDSPIGTIIRENNTVLDVYANYVLATYIINYRVEFDEGTEETEYTNPNNVLTFDLNSFASGSIKLKKAEDNINYFYGWFLNGDESNEITEITEEMGYEDINLVGIFSKNKKYEITFEDSNTYNSSIPSDNRLPNSILAKFKQFASTLDKVTLPYSVTNIYDSDENKMYYATFKFSDGTEFNKDRDINSNTVIYIVWEKKLVVNYLNESNTPVANQYIIPNKEVTLFDASRFDESYVSFVDTSDANCHIQKTLNGFSKELKGTKVYELGQTINNLNNDMILYPYYDKNYTYLLECQINASQGATFGSDGSYNVNIDGKESFDIKKKTGTNKYIGENAIITITINEAYYAWVTWDKNYFNWSITGVSNNLIISNEKVLSGNTKTSHIIKFKMPSKKVTINLWK